MAKQDITRIIDILEGRAWNSTPEVRAKLMTLIRKRMNDEARGIPGDSIQGAVWERRIVELIYDERETKAKTLSAVATYCVNSEIIHTPENSKDTESPPPSSEARCRRMNTEQFIQLCERPSWKANLRSAPESVQRLYEAKATFDETGLGSLPFADVTETLGKNGGKIRKAMERGPISQRADPPIEVNPGALRKLGLAAEADAQEKRRTGTPTMTPEKRPSPVQRYTPSPVNPSPSEFRPVSRAGMEPDEEVEHLFRGL